MMQSLRQYQQGMQIAGRHYGVDEAGRGALAGPLSVAAVEYPFPREMDVQDSKTLSRPLREERCRFITEECHYVCVLIHQDWIDRNGIQAAEAEGLLQAVTQLASWGRNPGEDFDWPEIIVCDGTPDTWGGATRFGKNFEERLRFMVAGDAQVPAISAASIVAKVMRDNYMMNEAHVRFPEYGFDKHMGYGTSDHLDKLWEHGSCELHRHTFRPVSLRDDAGS